MTEDRRSCWNEIKTLTGKEFHTLDRGNPFRIVAVEDTFLDGKVVLTGMPRRIPRKEIDKAFLKLVENGELTRSEIQRTCSPRNPAYVAMILAQLAGVT